MLWLSVWLAGAGAEAESLGQGLFVLGQLVQLASLEFPTIHMNFCLLLNNISASKLMISGNCHAGKIIF